MRLSPSGDEALLALLEGPPGQARRRYPLAERDPLAVAFAPDPDHSNVVVVNAIATEGEGTDEV